MLSILKIGLRLLLLICVFYHLEVQASSAPYCASTSGVSPGSANFCENCNKRDQQRLGISVYENITEPIHPPGFTWRNTIDEPDTEHFVIIDVTRIEVEGKPLFGWFHFRIRIDDDRPFYAYLIQVEDEDNRRTIGEFTTELAGACDGGKLDKTPTQSQILPCQSVFEFQTTLPNSVAYYREAKAKGKNIIRSDKANEIHLNWKIPPGDPCAFTKRFIIRAEILCAGDNVELKKCTNGHCPNAPKLHIHTRHIIHMPDLEIGKQFHHAQPLPLFFDPRSVNCRVPIPTFPTDESCSILGTTTAFLQPFIQTIEIKTDCAKLYIASDSPNRDINLTILGKPYCRQASFSGAGATLVPSSGCASFIDQLDRIKRGEADRGEKRLNELFLGRCHYPAPVKVKTFVSDPEAPHICKKIYGLGLEDFVKIESYGTHTLGRNKDHIPDIKYIKTLETPSEYIKNIRYDTCNCYPDRRGGGDASLRRRLASTVPPRVQPPVDYPVAEEANPGQKKLVSASFSELGVNKSAQDSPNYPTRTISKFARRAHMTHGSLIVFAFMFFLPVGIFIARFLKESTHNMTVMTYDFWYQAHVFMILAAFFCIVCGSYVTGAVTYWQTKGVSTTIHPKLHKNIGWVTVAIFMVTLICGPFRSMLCIKVSVIIHSVAGDISYYFGLLTLFLYLIGFKDDGHDGLIALCILGFWVFVDIGFRVGMTLFMIQMDRKDGVKRNFYPAIELVVVDRNASGRMIRIISFVVYASLSLVCTFAFLVFTWRAHERVDAAVDIFNGKYEDRRNRY